MRIYTCYVKNQNTRNYQHTYSRPLEMEDNPSGNLASWLIKEEGKICNTTSSFPRSRYRIFTIHSSTGDTALYSQPRILCLMHVHATQPPQLAISGAANKERKYNAD